MINIMYLVLTAILALNVSAEILNAFKTVDRSLVTATGIANQKTDDIFKSFQKKKEDEKTREKAEKWLPVAEEAKKLSNEMYNYIEEMKKELKKEAQGHKDEQGQEVYKEDDLEAGTRLFVEAPPEGKGKGKEMFAKLQAFRDKILAVDSLILKEPISKEKSIRSLVGPGIPIDLSIPKSGAGNSDKQAWEFGYFHMTPAVAAITILSKFENDVKNTEAQVVEFCHKQIGEVEVIYDAFQAFAQSNTQYAMPGEELVITAGIGAFSKAAKPIITVDGANVVVKEDGTAEYKTVVSNSGSFSKKVRVTYTRPDGKPDFVDKEVKYTVGVPSGLVVSTDKTRVFYQGLANPLTVTGGSGDEKVNVSVQGPGVTSSKTGPGAYTINCENLGNAIVTATDGKNTQKITIPIKRVPSPTAKVGGQTGGPIGANVFRVQKGVAAEMIDFVFEGVKYDVVSFTLVCTGKGFEESGLGYTEVSGPYFSAEAQALIKRCQAGSTVIIDDIKVKGPGGTRKLDQNISFTLQ